MVFDSFRLATRGLMVLSTAGVEEAGLAWHIGLARELPPAGGEKGRAMS